METQEGKVLNTNTLVRDLDKLFNHQTGYVRGQGYIFDVSSDINIDPLTGVLNIPLVEAHINSITLKGNKLTKPVVVTREFRSQVGDVLDEKKLQRDLTRVYNLGLFDEVGPFDEVSNDVGKVDITIPLTEKRSGTVSVGVGYSSTSKLVGRAELAQNNFRGLGERVSLQWEVGGINSQSSLEAGFFEPYLDKKHTSLDVDLYDKAVYRFNSSTISGGSNTSISGSSNTYLERRRGGVLGLNRAISDALTVGITGRYESVSTDDVELQTSNEFIRQKGNVAGLGGRAIYSNRDNDTAPAAGGLESFSYELVTATTRPVNDLIPSPLSPGREVFGKLGIDLRRYTSLNGKRAPGKFNQPKRVLATRLLIGTTARNIPFFEQYFLGGADSLRGYDTDRFWGSNLALVQAELRIPVGKDNNFQGVLLFDGRRRLGFHLPAAGLAAAHGLQTGSRLWRRHPAGHAHRPDPLRLCDPDHRFARRPDPVQHRTVFLAIKITLTIKEQHEIAHHKSSLRLRGRRAPSGRRKLPARAGRPLRGHAPVRQCGSQQAPGPIHQKHQV